MHSPITMYAGSLKSAILAIIAFLHWKFPGNTFHLNKMLKTEIM